MRGLPFCDACTATGKGTGGSSDFVPLRHGAGGVVSRINTAASLHRTVAHGCLRRAGLVVAEPGRSGSIAGCQGENLAAASSGWIRPKADVDKQALSCVFKHWRTC